MATYTFDKIEYNSNTYVVQDSGALQLTGGQVTGPVTFGNTISVDEATIGDLVVNGAASFTNNIQANTINGVTVGNSPKFTDTTYSSLSAASGGTAVSLVTTGEKYTWNNKIGATTPTIATDTGTSTVTLSHGGKYKLTAGGGSVVFTMPSDNNTTYSAGTGLSLSSTTFSVKLGYTTSGNNRAVQADTNGNLYVVQKDDNTDTHRPIQMNGTEILGNNTTALNLKAGTGISLANSSGTVTITNSSTNTDEKVKSTPATAATTYYLIASTSSSENTATTSKHASLAAYTTADSGTSGYTQLRLGNTTATSSAGGKEGQIRLYGTTATYYVDLKAGAPSANRTITFPNATGTVALTSDIPDVSGFITTDSDTKVSTAAVTSGTTYYPVVGADTTSAATKFYDKTGIVYAGTNGTANGSNGNALLTLGNSTASSSANWKKGTVRLYGTSAYYVDLVSGAPTGNKTITFPDKTGTVALTSDIPTSLPASDVYSWAKASSKPSYTASEVGALASNTTYVSTVTTSAGTHSTISSKSGAVSFNVPTKTSHLTNDSNFVTSSGVTSVATGAGLTGGTITGTGTLKANLNSETSLGTIGTTDKLYAVGVDSNGKLCVNVPWSDTTYTNLKLGQGYGTCSTASATAAKTVTCSGYQLVTGGIIGILFSSGATSIYTLNINSTGAKAVKYRATTATSSAPINPTIGTNYLAYFMYDGTNYVLLNWQHTTATTSLNGYMSSDDKTKLNGIATGATANSITLNGSANASPSFYAPTSAGTSGYYLKSNGSGAPTWATIALDKDYLYFDSEDDYGITIGSEGGDGDRSVIKAVAATYNNFAGVKPWFSTTGASTLASGSAGTNTSTPSINARSTTAGKYYAVEIDKNGRLFVNIPWSNTDTYVTQTSDTGSNWRKVLSTSGYNASSSATVTIASPSAAFYNNNVSMQPSTGSLYVGGSYYMYLNASTSDTLYSAINDLGWISSVIE